MSNAAPIDRLRALAQELLSLAAELESSSETEADPKQPTTPRTLGQEPQWAPDWRRSWKFLKAFEDAGGSLSPKEVSLTALRTGYSSPAATNGYYRGDGAALRRNGDRRELTDAGYAYLREWEGYFGPGGLYE
jgi:hypothetical protein